MSTSSPHRSILFQAGDHYGNLVLNTRKRPEDEFDFYACAFHRAGKTLAQQVMADYRNDLDACPLIFLYRHALELYLKAVIRIGGVILQLSNTISAATDKALTGHSLAKLLPAVKQVLDHVGWTWEIDDPNLHTFDDFSALAYDLDRVDAGSYTFRYPTDKHDRGLVPNDFTINIPRFCQLMDGVLDIWDAATTGLRALRQQSLAAAYQHQNQENE